MKYRVFTLMGVLALSMGTISQAQGYDDIYGDTETKSTKKVVVKTNKPNNVTVVRRTVGQSTVTPITMGTKVTSSNISDNSTWDVDAYNRRGADYDVATDTVEDNTMFANTSRIERFYNPDVVVKSDDDELLELYFNDNTNVNLIVGTTNYVPMWSRGYYSSWYSLYDPFDPFYDPYYYRPWGYYSSWGWHRPWGGWYGWHSSWSWGWARPWGWNSFGWGWGHHPGGYWGGHWGHHGWDRPGGYRGWDRPGYHSYHSGLGTMTRRPTSRLGNNHYGVGMNSNRNGVSRRVGTTGSRVGVGSMNTGRPRPATQQGMNTGRRASSQIGNMGGGMVTGRTSRDITTRSTGMTRNSQSTGAATRRGYESSQPRRNYDSGSSRSYNSGSSRSYNSGSSSRSSGSYSGGGYSGGSSRGGGGYSGGGGGGRRH